MRDDDLNLFKDEDEDFEDDVFPSIDDDNDGEGEQEELDPADEEGWEHNIEKLNDL